MHDYNAGYADLDEAPDAASGDAIRYRQWYDSNDSGYANAAGQAGHTIGVYVYERDGYYWVGRNVNATVASGGCASCQLFGGSDPTVMPSNVHTIVAVTPSASHSPNPSYWSRLGGGLPGGAIVYTPGRPYTRQTFP